MKKILITGKDSYIGTQFEEYVRKTAPEEYRIDTLDLLNPRWTDAAFSGYDAVLHVAGIVHQKETKENAQLYFDVNRDLAAAVAVKAKEAGVGQFIFMSTMSVYGKDVGVLTADTRPEPRSNYGLSKLAAEEQISLLSDDAFRVCILRPPMVYGKGCRGNFNEVAGLVKKLPFFPKIKNARSMIYIDNLCCFIKQCVDRRLSGVYRPQNREYVRTDQMAKLIAEAYGKKLHLSPTLGCAVALMRPFFKSARKAFGTLVYDEPDRDISYCTVDFEESVRRCAEV